MFKKFLRYLEGTVRVRVRGATIERFLNLCSRHDIALHAMKRVQIDELHATIATADFKRLQKQMGRTGCRVHLLRRRGMPFLARRFRKRYMLFGGLALLGGLCWVLTSFVWVVQLDVERGISEYQLERNLTELGIYSGAYLNAIDAASVRAEMMYRMPELAFISINLHGNRLDVTAHARRTKPQMVDNDLPTSVFATKAGLITKMTVKEGTPMKEVGEMVEAGDMLVSSIKLPTGEQGQARKSHAAAQVEARTWYSSTICRLPRTGQKEYTQREKTRYACVIGKRRINLFLGSSISDEHSDKIISRHKIIIADSVEVPIQLEKQTVRPYAMSALAAEEEQLRTEMEQNALEQLRGRIEGTVTAHTTTFRQMDGGAYQLTVYAECLEQIAEEAVDTQELPVTDEDEKTE